MLRATHLSEILLKMPELQTLFKFLLMLCPKLIKGSLGFIQLGQEPGREERHCAVCWSDPWGLGKNHPPRWEAPVGGSVPKQPSQASRLLLSWGLKPRIRR